MNAPDKLPLMKRSMRLLVNQMREEDYVSIVVYAGAAGVVLEPTSGARKERILEAIERLSAGGSTAGGAGIRLAYDLARRHFRQDGNNRVILATDGDFNIGESSDAAMVRLVEERRGEGTFLTVLGFGTGNLQNTKMQEMAQHGNGSYAYIDSVDEARKVLVGEMGGTLLTVASDVKIQVEFNPERVAAYRLIGYENRLLADEDFNDDTKDAGELGAGHTVTALYEIVPVGVESDLTTAGVDPLRYQRPEAAGQGRERRRDRAGQATDELAFVKVRYKNPGEDESRLLTHPVRDTGSDALSTDLRFASAVAGFGMLLRESEYVNDFTSEDALRLAISGMGDDPGGYRHAFLQMIYAYQEITGVESTDPDRDRPWDVR
jgi:Ca-activated chloride channel family protein